MRGARQSANGETGAATAVPAYPQRNTNSIADSSRDRLVAVEIRGRVFMAPAGRPGARALASALALRARLLS